MDMVDYWWWYLEVLQHLDDLMVFSSFKGEAEKSNTLMLDWQRT